MVKNWYFVLPGMSGNVTYPFTNGQDAVAMMSIPAQGHDPNNQEVAQGFNQHMITTSGEYLYDPSYGTPRLPPANGQADYKTYEDSAFDAYRQMNAVGKCLCRKNDVMPQSPSDVNAALSPIN